MQDDRTTVGDATDCSVDLVGPARDAICVRGRFRTECRGEDGALKWVEEYDNLVVNTGKNQMLDTALAATVAIVGPFMGLISSVSYGAGVVAGDTMASHSGWTEAGVANAPTYSGTRKTCVWSAASGGIKSLSAALMFAITGTGIVKGTFIVFGPGAVNTIDNASGVLFSGGTFVSGDRSVISGDTINASYTITLA